MSNNIVSTPISNSLGENIDIFINVYNGNNLPKADVTGLSDPFVVIVYNSANSKKGNNQEKIKTSVKKTTLNPTWNQIYHLENVLPATDIKVSVWDWDSPLKMKSADFLGDFAIPVDSIPLDKKLIQRFFLHQNSKQAGDVLFVIYATRTRDVLKENVKKLKENVSIKPEEVKDIHPAVANGKSRLSVEIVKINGLSTKSQDAAIYLEVSVGSQMAETKICKPKHGLLFGDVLFFELSSASGTLMFNFKEWNKFSTNPLLSTLTIELSTLPKNEIISKTYELTTKSASVELKLNFVSQNNIPENEILLPGMKSTEEDDKWSSTTEIFESYRDEDVPKSVVTKNCYENYHFETGPKSLTKNLDPTLPDFDNDFYFKGYDDVISKDEKKKAYYARGKQEDYVIVTSSASDGIMKAMIYSKRGVFRIFVKEGESHLIQAIQHTENTSEPLKLKKFESYDIWEKVRNFENYYKKPTYKFGVVYGKANQHTEMEFLSNKDTSPELLEFYNLLGKTIPLKGHTGFRGGLDVVNDTTGTQTIYTTFKNIEIMLHVSTMLLHDDTDPQQLQKKRHIGNDVCVVIFKELSGKNDLVDLDTFVSQFNHVFIIVSPVEVQKEKKYKVTIAVKPSISGFMPRLDNGEYFNRDASFVEFLYKKLINGERCSMTSSYFVNANRNARKGLLKEMIDVCQ